MMSTRRESLKKGEVRLSLNCTGDPPVLLCGKKRWSSGKTTAEQESITDAESVDAISKSHGEKIEYEIANLEQELELVFRKKAFVILKEAAIQTAIQVLKGQKAEFLAAVEEHKDLLGIIQKLKAESSKLTDLLGDDESKDAFLKKTSSNSQLYELQDLLAERNTALEQGEQVMNRLLERAIDLEHSLRDGIQRKSQDFVATRTTVEEENLEAHEKLTISASHLRQSIEEQDRMNKGKEVFLGNTRELQARMSCLEQGGEQHQDELRQMESRLALANSDELLSNNEQVQLVPQQSREELDGYQDFGDVETVRGIASPIQRSPKFSWLSDLKMLRQSDISWGLHESSMEVANSDTSSSRELAICDLSSFEEDCRATSEVNSLFTP